MVGRSAELQAMHAFLGDVRPGMRALVIEGEPGIGKTSLFNAGLEAQPGKGSTLVARPVQAEAKLSHSALVDLLEPVADEFLPRLPPPQQRALEAVLFRIEADRDARPRTLSIAVLGLLRLRAEKGPILLAIDDLQWLDAGTHDVLAFALRRLHAEPIALIATMRPLQQQQDRPILASVPQDRCHKLLLGPLTVTELRAILDRDLREPLPRATLMRIHESSGGNPYYALQMLSALHRIGLKLSPGQALPIPETLDGLLTERLDRLSKSARAVTLAASVVARPTVEAVVAIAGGSPTAQHALGRAVTARVLTRDGELLRFTHPLLASTVYGRATVEQRRRVHADAAAVVADQEEQARHLALAASGPDETVALALDKAAHTARSRGAPLSGAELHELALMLTPQERSVDRVRRMVNAATAYVDAGDTERAAALLEQAVACSSSGTERADALRHLAVVRSISENWVAALELLTQALGEAAAGSRTKALIMVDLIAASLVLGDIPGAFDRGQDALRMIDQAGADDLRAMAQASVAFVSLLLGRGLDLTLLENAMTSEQRSEPWWHAIVSPQALAGITCKYSDRFGDAREALVTEVRRLRANGDERKLPFVLFHLTELECWSGNWDLAEAYAHEADALMSLPGFKAYRVVSLYGRALVDACRGRTETAISRAQECLRLATEVSNVAVAQQALSVLGLIEIARGNPAGADSYLRPLADSVTAVGLAEPAVVRFVPDEIEALIALGQLAQARSLLNAFQERATALERRWALATAARCRALLLAAEGQLAEALLALDDALAWHAELPMPLELGRTLLVKGEIQRRARHWRLARQTLERALSIFTGLGAAAWAEKARVALTRVSGRRASSSQLTPSEREAARLVAAGLSNKEIARLLSVTVNTVQTTLLHAYRKLGVRSRTQLAAHLLDGHAGLKDH